MSLLCYKFAASLDAEVFMDDRLGNIEIFQDHFQSPLPSTSESPQKKKFISHQRTEYSSRYFYSRRKNKLIVKNQ